MEILNKIKVYILFSLLFATLTACKNKAVYEKTNSGQLVEILPTELVNKTWVIYGGQDESYDVLFKRFNSKTYPFYVKTGDSSFFMVEGDIETYLLELKSNKIVKVNDSYKMYLNSQFVDFITLTWKEKKRGIISVEYTYKVLPESISDSVFTVDYVNKDFITEGNFPKLKEQKKKAESEIFIEEETTEGIGSYEYLKDLPIQGWFYCEDSKEKGNYEVGISFLDEEHVIHNKDGSVLKNMPNHIEIDLNNALRIACSVKKIKASSNKYVLFYEHRINHTMTLYIPFYKDAQYYSSNHPIAEIDILDDNTIKRKWIGFYNRRTKKVENYAKKYGWEKGCNNILKRIKDGSLVNSAL
ncbi:hypothetical protein [Aquimarina agarivorans]|uniref:hypothetical protein n=1 Tax=Aquimarina agarivorans TaxID=980584 RepID=UPI000248EADC|nr:hypothetical protein [Aquimarina agarivorans]